MALEKELETYERHRDELLSFEGEWVVIGGDEVVGHYAAYVDALRAGYDKFGVTSFLVKKIEATESVQFFTRDMLDACPTLDKA